MTEPEFTVEMMCIESVIEREITAKMTQKQIAQTYRMGLESSWPTDWAKVNAMILARWPKGLTRIKEMAWSGKCFEKKDQS